MTSSNHLSVFLCCHLRISTSRIVKITPFARHLGKVPVTTNSSQNEITDSAKMNSMHRQFGKLMKKGAGDNANVAVLLNDYEDADKMLTKVHPNH